MGRIPTAVAGLAIGACVLLPAAAGAESEGAGPTVAMAPMAGDALGSTGWFNAASSGTDGIRVAVSAVGSVSGVKCTSGASTLLDAASAAGTLALADGIHEVTCTALDGEGTGGAETMTFRVDQTAPKLAPTVSPNPIPLGAAATGRANATDATSGVATSSCAEPDTSTPGEKQLECIAADAAGNQGEMSATYMVSSKAAAGGAKTPSKITLPRRRCGKALKIGVTGAVTKLVAKVGSKKARLGKGYVLRKPPRGRFTLKVSATGADGKPVSAQRTYKGCRRKK